MTDTGKKKDDGQKDSPEEKFQELSKIEQELGLIREEIAAAFKETIPEVKEPDKKK